MKNLYVYGAVIAVALVVLGFVVYSQKDMFERLPMLEKKGNKKDCDDCKDKVKDAMCVEPDSDECGCQQKEVCKGVCNLEEPVEMYTEKDKLNELAWDEMKAMYHGYTTECYTGCTSTVMRAKDVCKMNCRSVCEASMEPIKDSIFTEEDAAIFKAKCVNSCQVTNCTNFVVM
jgi:hypothetical protein